MNAIAADVGMVMKKLVFACLGAVLASGWPVSAPAATVGDASACARGDSAVLVRVAGFKERRGTVRVQVYGANPSDFLAKGRKLKRVDVPVTAARMEVCVDLPGPGDYAVAVRHDVDGNGKSGWSDGGGFSRNPHITLVNLKPRHRDVVIRVGNGVRPVDVLLNYRQGLSIGPVAS